MSAIMLLGTYKYVFQSMLHECIPMKQKRVSSLMIYSQALADYNYVSDWSLYVSVVCTWSSMASVTCCNVHVLVCMSSHNMLQLDTVTTVWSRQAWNKWPLLTSIHVTLTILW